MQVDQELVQTARIGNLNAAQVKFEEGACVDDEVDKAVGGHAAIADRIDNEPAEAILASSKGVVSPSPVEEMHEVKSASEESTATAESTEPVGVCHRKLKDPVVLAKDFVQLWKELGKMGVYALLDKLKGTCRTFQSSVPPPPLPDMEIREMLRQMSSTSDWEGWPDHFTAVVTNCLLQCSGSTDQICQRLSYVFQSLYFVDGRERISNDAFFSSENKCKENVDMFAQYITSCMRLYAEWKFYAPYLCVIQSPGYGKSKLLTELKSHFHVVYICLRHNGWDSDFPNTAVPARTPLLADQLLSCTDEKEFGAFIAACIQVASTYTKQELAEAMYPFNDAALEFGECVIREMNNILATKRNTRLPSGPIGAKGSDCHGIILAVDKASALLRTNYGGETSDVTRMKFDMFRRALKTVVPPEAQNVFCVLANTSFKTCTYAPTGREFRITDKLFSPFYHFFTLGQVRSQVKSVKTIRERICQGPNTTTIFSYDLQRLVELSRPLFVQCWDSYDGVGNAWWTLRNFTTLKLYFPQVLCDLGSCRSKPRDVELENCVVASVLAIRINLFPVSEKVKRDLVQYHMATLISVSEDLNLLIKYVEEPVIGEAAADMMANIAMEPVLSRFENMIMKGHYGYSVDRSDIAQAIGMIILCRVFDFLATKNRQNPARLQPEVMADPILLSEFLSTLCGVRPELVSDALEASGMNYGGICILQFIRIEAQTKIHMGMLIEAAKRRVAFACNVGEHGVDMIIPVFLPAAERMQEAEKRVDMEKLDEHHIGVVMVQVKNYNDGPKFSPAVLESIHRSLVSHARQYGQGGVRCCSLLMAVGDEEILCSHYRRDPSFFFNLKSTPLTCLSRESLDTLRRLTRPSKLMDEDNLKRLSHYGVIIPNEVYAALSPCSSNA